MSNPAQVQWNTYRAAVRVTVLAIALGVGNRAAAEPPGSATAHLAMNLCEQANELAEADQLATLTRGRQLAEQAIATDEHDAKAHFALVCTLGKQMQVSGIGLSTWSNFRQLRRELDATLTLAPNDPDALAAKGALLLHLPRFLGGDAAEAERLLHLALEIEPDNGNARRYLAEALEDRGATDQARALLASR